MADAVTHIKYRKPPVVQAVVNVHFEKHIAKKDMSRFVRSLKSKFPLQEVSLRLIEGSGIDVKDAQIAQDGFRCSSEDNRQSVVLFPWGFAYCEYAPYQDWQTLVSNAREHFAKLTAVTGYIKISTLSTRYINRIDIPFAGNASEFDVQEYFNIRIEARTALRNYEEESFVIGIASKHTKFPIKCNVQFGPHPEVLLQHLSYNLELEVSTADELPSKADDVWEKLYSLRQHKNDLFEACITDKTRAFLQ